MIRIGNLCFRYSGAEKSALRGIDLKIQDGEFVLITGPSGGGKSTLCRCLNGLVPHFHGGKIYGEIEVEGLDVLGRSPGELAARVGMVFQDPENQMVADEVEREVAFGLENFGFTRSLMARRVEEALNAVGVAHLRHRSVTGLSGGELQKIAIASVLALHPSVLVLDEPSSELDPKSTEDLFNLVAKLNNELGLTVVLVEHRLEKVVRHVDRLILLQDGVILADGNPRQVLSTAQLYQSGVGIPAVARLSHGLMQKGIDYGDTFLTVKESRSALEKVFRERDYRPKRDIQDRFSPKPKGTPLIEARKLQYAYLDGPVVLKGINLRIAKGEFVALMGRNGSGKSTLLKHFMGLLKPAKGDVVVCGLNTKETDTARMAKDIGYIFQNPNLHLFADSVEEEVAFKLKNLGFDDREQERMITEVLDRFGLTEYRGRYPRDLSSGEKQRVAIASVLVSQPEVVLLDEPMRGLEHRLKSELMESVGRYREDGQTVVLATQDVETVAEYADRVILLGEGEVVADGDKREILSEALLFSPQINRVAQSLRNHGFPQDVLTADEALNLI